MTTQIPILKEDNGTTKCAVDIWAVGPDDVPYVAAQRFIYIPTGLAEGYLEIKGRVEARRDVSNSARALAKGISKRVKAAVAAGDSAALATIASDFGVEPSVLLDVAAEG